MTQEKTEVAKTGGISTIQDLVHSQGFMNKVAKQSAKGFDVDRMMGAVWTAIQKNPDLGNCTLDSMALALKEAGQRGLMPDGIMGEAYLVPMKDHKKGITNCTLWVGAKGYIKTARNSGEVDHISVNTVYEDDYFDCELGMTPRLEHKPDFTSSKRKDPNIVGCYVIAHLKSGHTEITFMTRDEIKKIQAGSKAGTSGPWKDHWQEMARKTVIRRAMKYLPLSADVMEFIQKDMEREEPKRVFDADDEDVHTPAKSIEALTSDLKGEVDTEGTLVCSECGIEGDIGPGGNCSPCQARLDNEQ